MTANIKKTAPSPADAAAAVALAFLTPRRPARERPLALPGSEWLRVATLDGDVAVMRAGHGPQVLLQHGWEGQASDLTAFASALLDKGFSVLAMDLPAHGRSDGTSSSIPASARALLAVGQALGPVHGVIAHSMGAPIVVEALHAGLVAARVVLIAAPAEYANYARRFAAAAGLDEPGAEALLGHLRSLLGIDLQDVSLPARARHRSQPALFIHSADDTVVSVDDGRASQAAWPGAQWLQVDGLGHGRLLADPVVVAQAVQFLSSSQPTKDVP